MNTMERHQDYDDYENDYEPGYRPRRAARYRADERSRATPPGLLRRVSWGAIFAGSITAVAVMALLSILGLSIGFGVIDPTFDENPVSGLGTGTMVWLAITGLISMFVGGFIAGRFAGLPRMMSSALHGVVVWALASLALIYFASSSIGYLATGAIGVVSQTASAATSVMSSAAVMSGNAVQAVGQAMPDQLPASVRNAMERRDMTLESVQTELVQILNGAGIGQDDVRQATGATRNLVGDLAKSPMDAGRDFQQYYNKLIGGSDAVISEQERQNAINIISRRTGISPQEAERALQNVEQRVQTAQQQFVEAANAAQKTARQAAETTLNTLTQAAFAAFAALLLGLGAAAIGATTGAPQRPRVE